MNKNFKVLFNRARNSLVVANELKTSFGKSKSVVQAATAACVLWLSLGGGCN